MQTVHAGPSQGSAPSSEERAWAMLCHVSAFVGFVFPLANVLGPLLVWMFKRDQMPLVREHGRESVNFQISYSVYALVIALACLGAVLLGMFIVGSPTPGAPPPGWIFAPFCLAVPLVLAQLVLVVIASMRAYQGLPWRYPLTFRLVT